MSELNRIPDQKDVVVVIDDDRAVLSSLEFSLQVEGFEVKTYASGDELLLADWMPTRGCFIIDYLLPGINGLDLAISLREKGMSLPVILITTHPNRLLRQSAAAEGIEIVEKPLLGNLLSERIRAAVRPYAGDTASC